MLRDMEEEQDDRVCRRCESYWILYGCYPGPEKLRRLAQKSEQIASFANNPPPPGYCQMRIVSRTSTSSSTGAQSTASTSAMHVRLLQETTTMSCVPPRDKRTSRKKGAPCENDMCKDTTAQRCAWGESKKAHVCNACSSSSRETAVGQTDFLAETSERVPNYPPMKKHSQGTTTTSSAFFQREARIVYRGPLRDITPVPVVRLENRTCGICSKTSKGNRATKLPSLLKPLDLVVDDHILLASNNLKRCRHTLR